MRHYLLFSGKYKGVKLKPKKNTIRLESTVLLDVAFPAKEVLLTKIT